MFYMWTLYGFWKFNATKNIVVIIVIITPSFNAILHKQYLLNFLLQSLILLKTNK